jgi:nicotinamidase/pyrazinamidase
VLMDYQTTTALLVVDVQNDFADPSGNLYVQGGEEAIDFINDQIAAAEKAGATVAYTQDWHPESTPHFEKDGGVWPVHCVADTFGAEFHPDLHIVDDAVFIKKGVGGEDGYSAFTVRDPVSGDESPTGLAEKLASIESVAIVGLALDVCVKESALDAAEEFETTLLADGSRPVNLKPGDAARAVAEMVAAGVRVV